MAASFWTVATGIGWGKVKYCEVETIICKDCWDLDIANRPLGIIVSSCEKQSRPVGLSGPNRIRLITEAPNKLRVKAYFSGPIFIHFPVNMIRTYCHQLSSMMRSVFGFCHP